MAIALNAACHSPMTLCGGSGTPREYTRLTASRLAGIPTCGRPGDGGRDAHCAGAPAPVPRVHRAGDPAGPACGRGGRAAGRPQRSNRNFFNWADWCTAADTGAQLLWRVKSCLTLPVLALLPDGSYSSVLVNPKVRGKAREALLEAARGREDLDEDQARYVRVVEYEVPDRDGDGKGEVIALVTTITQMTAAPAPLLAEAYHQRWEHETGNAQLKTSLRGPGRVLRSRSPDMVRQEIYGYLLTHYALSALICRAATEAGIDPEPGQVQADRPHRPPPGR